jgi:hypothetical protein
MATAMSLADFTVMARIASSTLTLSPTGRPSLVGAWAAARGVIGTRSVSFRRPSLSASKVRYSVMTLVTEAG